MSLVGHFLPKSSAWSGSFLGLLLPRERTRVCRPKSLALAGAGHRLCQCLVRVLTCTVTDFPRSSSAHQYASDLTYARLARRYAATSSRICEVIASLPVTSSNANPISVTFVRELVFHRVSLCHSGSACHVPLPVPERFLLTALEQAPSLPVRLEPSSPLDLPPVPAITRPVERRGACFPSRALFLGGAKQRPAVFEGLR
jgi:hypothetical protein